MLRFGTTAVIIMIDKKILKCLMSWYYYENSFDTMDLQIGYGDLHQSAAHSLRTIGLRM